MNRLPSYLRIRILELLCEGVSMRSIARVLDVSPNTVNKLLIEAGRTCQAHHDATVRNLTPRYIECDEQWAFCYAKDRNVPFVIGDPDHAGDTWTWVAIDRDSKLVISWLVSPTRDTQHALPFMLDLRSRLASRVQLTTDGLQSYIEAVESAFGSDVDYAQLIKRYRTGDDGRRRYDGAERRIISGNPEYDMISTSFVERVNLTTRMSMRRYTRKTNGHSKRLEHHRYALALYLTHYNFCRRHSSTRTTPAVSAGLAEFPYDTGWILGLIDRA